MGPGEVALRLRKKWYEFRDAKRTQWPQIDFSTSACRNFPIPRLRLNRCVLQFSLMPSELLPVSCGFTGTSRLLPILRLIGSATIRQESTCRPEVCV